LLPVIGARTVVREHIWQGKAQLSTWSAWFPTFIATQEATQLSETTTMTPALPSYTHLFRDGQPKKPWIKLEADEIFSMLQAEFWGKDILEEKRKWQETQTEAHQMDTDEALANFAFPFDMESADVSNVWVREDYVLLYDECTTFFADPDNKKFRRRPPTIVITGQPGIGK
jgi:hypothetical protein